MTNSKSFACRDCGGRMRLIVEGASGKAVPVDDHTREVMLPIFGETSDGRQIGTKAVAYVIHAATCRRRRKAAQAPTAALGEDERDNLGGSHVEN